jgi:hypothetical protein
MLRYVVSHLLGFVGAVLGGVLGFYIFRWLASQGFYGLMIPGALLGGGCGLLARHESQERGIICGIAAALLALFAEWRVFPWVGEGHETLAYFVSNLRNLSPVTWLMVVVGAFIAYWLGRDAGFGWTGAASGRVHTVPTQRPEGQG